MKPRTGEMADIRGLVRRNAPDDGQLSHPHPLRVMHQDTAALHGELVDN